MKFNFRKILAGFLASMMIFGSTMVAFAAETGDTSGTGGLEGTVDTNVFAVVLPTVPDGSFDYIVDPEGLIASTEAARYTDKTFEEDATVFFPNSAEDATKDYSHISDAITVTNKSTMDVDITVTASVSDLSGVLMTDDSTFADDTTASLYLALTDGTNTAAIDAEDGATITTIIDAAPVNAYETVWSTDDSEYQYVLTTAAKEEGYEGFASYDFQMTGASNANGDWSALSEVAPALEITWSIAEHVDAPVVPVVVDAAPSIETVTYAMTANTAINVPISLGAGTLAATGVTSIKYTTTSGVLTTLPTTNYTVADGKITISATFVDVLIGANVTSRAFTVTFNDTAATAKVVTLTH